MNKAYSRINWVNDPDHTTPLNATNLNSMDSALDTIDDRVVALDSGKSTVTMTPALQSGTKVADYSIDGVEGSLYAPTGGGASALTDLTDTAISSPSNGQVLKYNTSTSKWENANESGGGGGSSSLSGLSDVALTTLSDGQFLAYDSATSKWKNVTGGGGSVDSVNGQYPDENGNVELNLDDINDVDITSASDGDALVYDATSHKWVNGAGGGGTSDYTQLTNKPSINGVTLSGNKTSSDLGISGGGSNENLLNNGWFTVNSKKLGGLSLTTNEQILVDDWKAYRSSGGSSYVDIRSTGLAIFPSLADDYTALRQYLDISVIGQTLTLSVKFDDGIHSWTFTPTSASEYYYSSIWTYNSCTVQFMFNNNEVSLLLKKTVNEDRYITLRAVKMEIGNGSTLATDYLPNYDLESIKCNGVMRSNRNLLDNPWFTVNQKGFTSGSAAQNSTPIDRWQVRFNATTLALVSSGLNITNTTDNHGLVQILDMPTDYVNTYTFSMLTSDGNIYTKTGKFQTDTSGQTQVISSPFPVYMGLWTIGGKLAPAVYLSGNSSTASLTITAMKLELGTESTLALDTAPDYASELLKCQRYYIPLPRYWNGLTAGINGTYHLVNISLPTKMRTTPTLSGSAYIEGALSGATVSETIATSSMTVRNADSQFIQIEVQGSNQFDKNGNVLFMPSSGAALSAEL